MIKVDFLVRKDSEYRGEEFARRRRVEVDGQPLWIVTPEDLVISKLDWARDSYSESPARRRPEPVGLGAGSRRGLPHTLDGPARARGPVS